MRTAHLEKLSAILRDPEATDNDRFVAWVMLRKYGCNRLRESCLGVRDTGTAIVMAWKGEDVVNRC